MDDVARQEANSVTVIISDQDIFKQSHNYKNHREYVEKLFKDKGYEVIQHHTLYAIDGKVKLQGLKYLRTDSDLYPTMEVRGIVGVNIKPIGAIEI